MESVYIIKVNGFDDIFKENAVSRNRAMYQNFKKYREAGCGNSWIEFKKRVFSCKKEGVDNE